VWLKGLHRLTGLQHLAAELYVSRPGQGDLGEMRNHNIILLRRAIPVLTHLTALHLSGNAAQDPALKHLGRLTCLQELQLIKTRTHSISEAAFNELPCTLTRLAYDVDSMGAASGPDFHFR
jgi:hypothetical protein